ncbi:uncharacterized protein RSE6_10947 [Rhynchosporium secalis]|uniref:Uncharacterized protein n=1 Tax=Rhynchosporium secalis TaxID=38038 RepID=A0A1E1MLS6_RHYSE|nr:uncharacterized protein RSE6_10947 [Rhynchosporium secalis]
MSVPEPMYRVKYDRAYNSLWYLSYHNEAIVSWLSWLSHPHRECQAAALPLEPARRQPTVANAGYELTGGSHTALGPGCQVKVYWDGFANLTAWADQTD